MREREEFFIIYRARFLASLPFSVRGRAEHSATGEHIKFLYAWCMGKFENNISRKLHNKTLITENLSPNDIRAIGRTAM